VKSTLLVMRDALRELSHKKLILALAVVALGVTLLLGQLVSWQQRIFAMGMDQVDKEQAAHPKQSDSKQAEMMEAGQEQMLSFFQAEFFGMSSLCGTIVTLFVFSTLIAGPLRRKELRSVLARPLTRSSYLAGRMSAGVVILAVFWLFMGLAFLLFFWKQGSALPTIVRFAPLLLFLKCLMLGMIALALSLFVRPVLAAVLTFFVSSDWVSSQGVLYLILPGDDRLSIGTQLLHGRAMEYHDVILASAYALSVAAVAVCCALLRFRRIDLA
jgi:Cu-processing system permease protein